MAGNETGADFLKLHTHARSVALTATQSSLSRGVAALDGNPAGLVVSPNPAAAAFFLSHQELFDGNALNALGLTLPSGTRPFAVGFSVTRLSYADQEGRDENRNLTNSVSASDLAVGTAFAWHVRGLNVGSQVRFIRQELAGASANGWSADLGFTSPTPLSKLSIGASVKNIGPDMKFINEKYHLPMMVNAGAALRVSPVVALTVDSEWRPYQDRISMGLGAELAPMDALTLRAGYMAQVANAVSNGQKDETQRGAFGGLSGFAGGLGFKIRQLALDYAISPFGELGEAHTFTVSGAFGGGETSGGARTFASKSDPFEVEQPDRMSVIFSLPAATESWWMHLKP
jgi:hypothetical protein